ncbi:hypothetical protein BKA56DRAFT_613762 [Ilyonectria sp. MPI-CAGE-AT-0026]|nr:hypothetical protein BKA56DRAFT_613762 [Ilyonectria sp. MPI-CAGE-AT-0026]
MPEFNSSPLSWTNSTTTSSTRPFFTEANFLASISALYCHRHSQIPTIHWSSLNPDTASLPLLLAVALSGAIFAHSAKDAATQGLCPSRELCDTTETYIFNLLETFVEPTIRDHENPNENAVESCRAALLIVRNLQINVFQDETHAWPILMWMATPGLEQAGVLAWGNLPLGNISDAFRHLEAGGQDGGPPFKPVLVHLVTPFQVQEVEFGSITITHC